MLAFTGARHLEVGLVARRLVRVVMIVKRIVDSRRPALVLLLTKVRYRIGNILDGLLISSNVLDQQTASGLGNCKEIVTN